MWLLAEKPRHLSEDPAPVPKDRTPRQTGLLSPWPVRRRGNCRKPGRVSPIRLSGCWAEPCLPLAVGAIPCQPGDRSLTTGDRPSLLHALEDGVGDLAALLRLELLRALVEREAVLPGLLFHVVDAQSRLAFQVPIGRDRPVGRFRLLRRVELHRPLQERLPFVLHFPLSVGGDGNRDRLQHLLVRLLAVCLLGRVLPRPL